MKATITIDMDNAAFADNGDATELARILRKLATRIEAEGPDYVPLHDSNGNRVGYFGVTNAQ